MSSKSGKGAAKGGVKKQKILRDNIQGITKPFIRRINLVAGGNSLSGLVYEETRGILKVFLEDVLRATITVTDHMRRRTVQSQDVRTAAVATGMFSMPEVDRTGGSNKMKEQVVSSGKTESGKSRFKRNTIARRKIQKYQSLSGGFLGQAQPFQRLIREIAQEFKHDLRFSKQTIATIQMMCEKMLVQLFTAANHIVKTDMRKVLTARDLEMARRMMGPRM